jgi:SAM-dependent methyltransferase
METWHKSDSFWETMAPFLFSERPWESAATEIDPTTALLGVEPGAAILDMCCGPGRYSLELARRGYRVTGVDRTTAYLGQARQQAEEEGLTLEFVEDDMRHFCRPGAFEGAMMMYTSFGYFEDPAENRQVLVQGLSLDLFGSRAFWYVEGVWLQLSGRLRRSWGCPLRSRGRKIGRCCAQVTSQSTDLPVHPHIGRRNRKRVNSGTHHDGARRRHRLGGYHCGHRRSHGGLLKPQLDAFFQPDLRV